MGFSFDLLIWKTLSKKSCLIFGEECARVILWVFISLLIRAILILTNVESYFPYGFVFAFPLLIQLLSKLFPSFEQNFPILPVRIAESVLGKTNPTRIFVIIPAHFIGSIIAIVIFKSVFPFFPNKVYHPIVHKNYWLIKDLLTEVFSNFLFSSIILILPYLLDVNRLSKVWTNIPIFPLILFHPHVTFNPAIVYALWYVQSCSVIPSVGSLPIERIVGPMLGAALAGIFCNIYFPDDPNSWCRKRS